MDKRPYKHPPVIPNDSSAENQADGAACAEPRPTPADQAYLGTTTAEQKVIKDGARTNRANKTATRPAPGTPRPATLAP